MSLMKSIDGRLYNVPDEEAARFLIPADKVADRLKEAGIQMPAGAGQPGSQPGQVQAYGHHHHHCGGGCGGGWGGGWGGFVVAAPYKNYSNYKNYNN
ncbi:MAG: hypothetical protein HZA91_12675, partial [Verrucomicrobia bacterium]|nr:hypothetical protein [Verrucomicrobiota bacterium]